MVKIEKIKNLKTPFYYYDMELLEKTIGIVKEEANKYGYMVHYALKANFDERILQKMRVAGFGVDCVSGNEVRYAVEKGFDTNKIVFAGVGKSDEEISYALDHKIFSFNCESKNELEVINEIAKSRCTVADVALRINPDLNPNTHKYISTGGKENKFGISPIELKEIIEMLPNLKNVNIIGLHFHIGSQILDLSDFERLALRVNELQEWFEEKGFNLSSINVGGGLGIDYVTPLETPIPNFKGYFKVFAENIKLRKGQTLHFELGRSLVGQCGTLLTKVLYNKETASGKEFVIVDAGMTDLIRPSLYQAKHYISNISSTFAERKSYNVGGPVCESSDIFDKDIELPITKRGDILAISSVGAYGQAMASQYNLRDFAPAVYSDSI
ncbi:MAG: diaminopimelate decarboxylase [Bacteroidetes bacterium]|nr:diaminopimelate decarboxylase [Bacteroidota bacterium]